MVRKGKMAVFESSNISEITDATPTKIGVHASSIYPYLYKFFELILIDSIFLLPWSIVHGPLAKFENSNISKTREAMPTKIGAHAFGTNLYFLGQFYFLTLINYSPWSDMRNPYSLLRHLIIIFRPLLH